MTFPLILATLMSMHMGGASFRDLLEESDEVGRHPIENPYQPGLNEYPSEYDGWHTGPFEVKVIWDKDLTVIPGPMGKVDLPQRVRLSYAPLYDAPLLSSRAYQMLDAIDALGGDEGLWVNPMTDRLEFIPLYDEGYSPSLLPIGPEWEDDWIFNVPRPVQDLFQPRQF